MVSWQQDYSPGCTHSLSDYSESIVCVTGKKNKKKPLSVLGNKWKVAIFDRSKL